MFDKIFKIKIDVISRKKAQRILEPRFDSKCFFVYEGGSICSLEDLAIAMESMSGSTYLYHANQEKNDFANWVRSTLGDDWLADKLQHSTNQVAATKLVTRRISHVQNILEQE